jgi:hypothetical protein
MEQTKETESRSRQKIHKSIAKVIHFVCQEVLTWPSIILPL